MTLSKALSTAVFKAAEAATVALPNSGARIQQALDTALVGGVQGLEEQQYAVTDAQQRSVTFVYNEQSRRVMGDCFCADAETAPQKLCMHRLAALLYVRASEAVAAQAPEEVPPADPWDAIEDAIVVAPDALPDDAPMPLTPPTRQPDHHVQHQHRGTVMTEAPASVNFTFDHQGRTVQLTLRDVDELRLLERLARVMGLFPPKPLEAPPVPAAPPPAEKTAPAQPAKAAAPPPAPPGGPLTFPAETLTCTSMKDGNALWSVKGKPFSQYGVRIWPEALVAAGFDLDSLDPRQSYALTGYTAEYVERESPAGKMVPNKVTRLVKAA